MFDSKVRIRTCGVLIKDGRVLLLKHEGLGTQGFLWSFPGGGLEFDESLEQCLVREFKEETALNVTVSAFLFLNEYQSRNLHAVEAFFEVKFISGQLKLGSDPELDKQILTDLNFFSLKEIKAMSHKVFHNVFKQINDVHDIVKLRGCYNFKE